MSNTYARIKTVDEVKSTKTLAVQEYTTDMELSLTAFMGGKKHTQLTVQTNSTVRSQCGIAYITLGDEEVDLLIAALLERKLKNISATGDEQSQFCPNDVPEETEE